MQCDIQKASIWKRMSAALLDIILVVILVTGMFGMLASLFQYDSYAARVKEVVVRYGEKYDLNYQMTQEEYDAMSEAEMTAYQQRVKQADEELWSTPADIKVYTDVTVILLVIITMGILIAMLLLEFAVPLLLGNGQTVGKKVFNLCLVRQDGVKIAPLQLFVRTMLGRFAIETMIPVCIAIMLIMGFGNPALLLLAAALVLSELVIIIKTENNCLLHDLMAGTVVADHSSQMIFSSVQELERYREKLEAERQSRQPY